MSLSLVDILFLITVVLLVLSGLRNGAVFSLINLLSVPIGLAVVFYYGPHFTALLASNGISATPLIAYIVLFLGTVFVLHILSGFVRGIVKSVPLISQGDTLLGGVIGFVEAWLLWVFLLAVLGVFLHNMQVTALQGVQLIPGFDVQASQLQSWHDFYNQALNHSLFARVNGLFVKDLPNLQLPALQK